MTQHAAGIHAAMFVKYTQAVAELLASVTLYLAWQVLTRNTASAELQSTYTAPTTRAARNTHTNDTRIITLSNTFIADASAA